jgi:hypothetical protein
MGFSDFPQKTLAVYSPDSLCARISWPRDYGKLHRRKRAEAGTGNVPASVYNLCPQRHTLLTKRLPVIEFDYGNILRVAHSLLADALFFVCTLAETALREKNLTIPAC